MAGGMSWVFEIHRGGRGEYEPGESDSFEPLDEVGAREVLASLGDLSGGDLLGPRATMRCSGSETHFPWK
jgi:hypothetical protein